LEAGNQIVPISANVTLVVKREDLVHPYISGNKFRKLKYNLLEAKSKNHTKLLTFGGAFSNHISAVAAVGRELGFETIGIIRGEELAGSANENPTLQYARQCGMRLEFVSRYQYRMKETEVFIESLQQQFGDFYLIPEGGTNALAISGCEEILTSEDTIFDYICCAVGTGGTIAGLINSSKPHQHILGFPALKGSFLQAEIRKFVRNENWSLISDYHFGGYGKINEELVRFLNTFHQQTGIPLDPIYTGKLFFGVMDLISKDYFAYGSKILLIHTGGIQGIKGMNIRLKNIQSPLIEYYD